ncbi:hypothetical protein HK102_001689 [Quaeritorhiza haematococci]|nr:hypothetical protein HK102_001689 [Quaeritorhiza haematococci]
MPTPSLRPRSCLLYKVLALATVLLTFFQTTSAQRFSRVVPGCFPVNNNLDQAQADTIDACLLRLPCLALAEPGSEVRIGLQHPSAQLPARCFCDPDQIIQPDPSNPLLANSCRNCPEDGTLRCGGTSFALSLHFVVRLPGVTFDVIIPSPPPVALVEAPTPSPTEEPTATTATPEATTATLTAPLSLSTQNSTITGRVVSGGSNLNQNTDFGVNNASVVVGTDPTPSAPKENHAVEAREGLPWWIYLCIGGGTVVCLTAGVVVVANKKGWLSSSTKEKKNADAAPWSISTHSVPGKGGDGLRSSDIEKYTTRSRSISSSLAMERGTTVNTNASPLTPSSPTSTHRPPSTLMWLQASKSETSTMYKTSPHLPTQNRQPGSPLSERHNQFRQRDEPPALTLNLTRNHRISGFSALNSPISPASPVSPVSPVSPSPARSSTKRTSLYKQTLVNVARQVGDVNSSSFVVNAAPQEVDMSSSPPHEPPSTPLFLSDKKEKQRYTSNVHSASTSTTVIPTQHASATWATPPSASDLPEVHQGRKWTRRAQTAKVVASSDPQNLGELQVAEGDEVVLFEVSDDGVGYAVHVATKAMGYIPLSLLDMPSSESSTAPSSAAAASSGSHFPAQSSSGQMTLRPSSRQSAYGVERPTSPVSFLAGFKPMSSLSRPNPETQQSSSSSKLRVSHVHTNFGASTTKFGSQSSDDTILDFEARKSVALKQQTNSRIFPSASRSTQPEAAIQFQEQSATKPVSLWLPSTSLENTLTRKWTALENELVLGHQRSPTPVLEEQQQPRTLSIHASSPQTIEIPVLGSSSSSSAANPIHVRTSSSPFGSNGYNGGDIKRATAVVAASPLDVIENMLREHTSPEDKGKKYMTEEEKQEADLFVSYLAAVSKELRERGGA